MLKLPWTRPAFLIGLLLLLLGWQLAGPLPSGRVTLLAWQQGRVSADTLWLAWWQLRLPRLAATVLAGAALGMAGHLLQSLSRNPLASPSVLGVTAGAQLGLIVAVLLPAGMALAAVPAVFGGGLLAVALCFVVAGGWQAHPLTLVLAGTVVSLLLSAVVSLLMVLFDQHVAGVALWSAGSLFQNGWQGVQTVLPWFLLACVLAWRYRAALPLLALGDDSAASLGLDVGRSRRRLLLVATLLSAVAVTLAGPVALVGLMAPNLLRLAGLQHPRRLLPASALAGAILLALADPIADWLADTSRSLLPLGVATALAGTPLLLWLIGRQGHLSLPPPAATAWQPYCHARRTASWLLPLCLLLLCVAPGVSFTQYVQAWQQPDALADWWLTLRLPRVLLAAGCGALLACSGVLLQGVVRNPLAGPELMGLSQGAALMVLAGLAMLGSVSPWGRLLLALLGSGIVLLVLLAISRRHAWAPLQLALAGMALATLGGALGSLLVAQAKLQVAQAVTWLAVPMAVAGTKSACSPGPWCAACRLHCTWPVRWICWPWAMRWRPAWGWRSGAAAALLCCWRRFAARRPWRSPGRSGLSAWLRRTWPCCWAVATIATGYGWRCCWAWCWACWPTGWGAVCCNLVTCRLALSPLCWGRLISCACWQRNDSGGWHDAPAPADARAAGTLCALCAAGRGAGTR